MAKAVGLIAIVALRTYYGFVQGVNIALEVGETYKVTKEEAKEHVGNAWAKLANEDDLSMADPEVGAEIENNKHSEQVNPSGAGLTVKKVGNELIANTAGTQNIATEETEQEANEASAEAAKNAADEAKIAAEEAAKKARK